MDEHRYTVTDDTLTVRSYRKGTRWIALRSVSSVHMIRLDGRTICTVKAPGAAPIVVSSPVLTSNEDTSDAHLQFVKFIKFLHERIVASGAEPICKSGSSFQYVLLIILFVLTGLWIVIILVAVFMMNKVVPQIVYGAFPAQLVIAFLIKSSVKPKRYSPFDIPLELLT